MSDVEDVLDQLHIGVVTVGREISAHCPFHTDAHPSFSMNAETGLWICYQCGESGTLEMLVEKVGGTVDVKTFLREAKVKKLKTPEPKPEPEETESNNLPLLYAQYEMFGVPPRWALNERMITRPAAELYRLKWDHGWIIPIWEPLGYELWGWQYKSPGTVANYPKAVKKSKTLFGVNELIGDQVVLVESPLDVGRLASVGIYAAASYGAMVSKAQIQVLIDVADRIVLALDNDEEGERQADKLYRYLNKFVVTKRITYPSGVKDPGEATDDQLEMMFHDDFQRHSSPLSRGSHRHDARSRLTPARPRDGFGQNSHVYRSH